MAFTAPLEGSKYRFSKDLPQIKDVIADIGDYTLPAMFMLHGDSNEVIPMQNLIDNVDHVTPELAFLQLKLGNSMTWADLYADQITALEETLEAYTIAYTDEETGGLLELESEEARAILA